VGQQRPHTSKFGGKKPVRPDVPITSMLYGTEQRRQHDEITKGHYRSLTTVYPKLRKHAVTYTPRQGSHPMHTRNQLHRWRGTNYAKQKEEVGRNLRQHKEILMKPPLLIDARDCPPQMLRARQMLMRPSTCIPGGGSGRKGSMGSSASEFEYMRMKREMPGSQYQETKTPKWPGSRSEVDVFNTMLPGPFPEGAEAWWERRESVAGRERKEEEDEPIYHHQRVNSALCRPKSEVEQSQRPLLGPRTPQLTPQRSPSLSPQQRAAVLSAARRPRPSSQGGGPPFVPGATPHLMLEGSPVKILTDADIFGYVSRPDGS